MNTRQTKKRLKKQIDKLQSDNDLMRRIIADSPKMQELYDVYTKPLNCTVATMQFQEYRSKRYLPPDRPNDAGFIALFKQAVAKDLLDKLKDHITYELDTECMTPTITASIFVGRKRGRGMNYGNGELPNGGWIPVSERLPEDEQEILFSTKTGRVHSGKYHDDDSANQWYSHRDKCRAWNNVVNAWMPLPEPYKTESEDKENNNE